MKQISQQSGFFRLPLELREEIYDLLLVNRLNNFEVSPLIIKSRCDTDVGQPKFRSGQLQISTASRDYSKVSTGIHIAILTTCKQIHTEAHDTLFTRNIFSIPLDLEFRSARVAQNDNGSSKRRKVAEDWFKPVSQKKGSSMSSAEKTLRQTRFADFLNCIGAGKAKTSIRNAGLIRNIEFTAAVTSDFYVLHSIDWLFAQHLSDVRLIRFGMVLRPDMNDPVSRPLLDLVPKDGTRPTITSRHDLRKAAGDFEVMYDQMVDFLNCYRTARGVRESIDNSHEQMDESKTRRVTEKDKSTDLKFSDGAEHAMEPLAGMTINGQVYKHGRKMPPSNEAATRPRVGTNYGIRKLEYNGHLFFDDARDILNICLWPEGRAKRYLRDLEGAVAERRKLGWKASDLKTIETNELKAAGLKGFEYERFYHPEDFDEDGRRVR